MKPVSRETTTVVRVGASQPLFVYGDKYSQDRPSAKDVPHQKNLSAYANKVYVGVGSMTKGEYETADRNRGTIKGSSKTVFRMEDYAKVVSNDDTDSLFDRTELLRRNEGSVSDRFHARRMADTVGGPGSDQWSASITAAVADGHGSLPCLSDQWYVGGFESARLAASVAAEKMSSLFSIEYARDKNGRKRLDPSKSVALYMLWEYLWGEQSEESKKALCRDLVEACSNVFVQCDDRVASAWAKSSGDASLDGPFWQWRHTKTGANWGFEDDDFFEDPRAVKEASKDPRVRNRVAVKKTEEGYVYRDGSTQKADFGCTLTTCTVSVESGLRACVIAGNAGDSSACRFSCDVKGIRYSWLTEDHGTENEREVRRLAKYGTRVFDRMPKYFAFAHKSGDDTTLLMPSRGLGHPSVDPGSGLTPKPSVKAEALYPGEFVILASDGFWNVAGLSRDQCAQAFCDEMSVQCHELIHKNAQTQDMTPSQVADKIAGLATSWIVGLNKRFEKSYNASVPMDNTTVVAMLCTTSTF